VADAGWVGVAVAPYPLDVPARRPSFIRMLWRAITLRCPWCGSWRNFLRGWFRRYPRCRSCGIAWRREEGFELGAVTVNTIVTFGALTLFMVVGFIMTAPDVPVLRFVLGLMAVGILLPILIYPFTYTVWLAFDLMVHPPDDKELAQAEAARADTRDSTAS
jgi:uncharacterized protein (DUF983 family)